MNSIINKKKPKSLTNVYAAFAYGLAYSTVIVQLHLNKHTHNHTLTRSVF